MNFINYKLMYKLLRIRAGFAIQKKLFVYDSGEYDQTNDSGIRATIFGATSFIGKSVVQTLGQIGSQMIMPIDRKNLRHYQHPKQLKVSGPTNKTWLQWESDLRDGRFIDDAVKNSNVVINLLGPRKNIKQRKDFQFINIDVAERIAKACTKHGVKRLIHFSAAAADPNSPSLDFQTKYEAEAIVKAAFPNVTIFRPCKMFGINDYCAHEIQRQSYFFMNKFVLVYDDCTTKKQPIRQADVAKCILNALKLDETKGKTYELGGPHVLTTLQMHEIIFNMLNHYPKLVYINPSLPMYIAKYIYNWQFFGQQVFRKKTIPEVVKGNVGTIEDLFVQPVSFKSGIFDIMRQYIYEEGMNDQDKQN